MAATVKVPALKPLNYQGRSYVRGEIVNASPVDALLMAQRGEVTLTKGVVIAPTPARQTQNLEAEASPSGGRRRRRRNTYQRRDMTPITEPSE